jgi:hypothetical protein
MATTENPFDDLQPIVDQSTFNRILKDLDDSPVSASASKRSASAKSASAKSASASRRSERQLARISPSEISAGGGNDLVDFEDVEDFSDEDLGGDEELDIYEDEMDVSPEQLDEAEAAIDRSVTPAQASDGMLNWVKRNILRQKPEDQALVLADEDDLDDLSDEDLDDLSDEDLDDLSDEDLDDLSDEDLDDLSDEDLDDLGDEDLDDSEDDSEDESEDERQMTAIQSAILEAATPSVKSSAKSSARTVSVQQRSARRSPLSASVSSVDLTPERSVTPSASKSPMLLASTVPPMVERLAVNMADHLVDIQGQPMGVVIVSSPVAPEDPESVASAVLSARIQEISPKVDTPEQLVDRISASLLTEKQKPRKRAAKGKKSKSRSKKKSKSRSKGRKSKSKGRKSKSKGRKSKMCSDNIPTGKKPCPKKCVAVNSYKRKSKGKVVTIRGYCRSHGIRCEFGRRLNGDCRVRKGSTTSKKKSNRKKAKTFGTSSMRSMAQQVAANYQ